MSESFCALRLMVRVRSNKRQELIQALSSFVAEQTVKPVRRLILQDLSDDGLICWMGDWHSREALNRFLRSQTYHAIKGAAQVLGQFEEVRFIECPSESGFDRLARAREPPRRFVRAGHVRGGHEVTCVGMPTTCGSSFPYRG